MRLYLFYSLFFLIVSAIKSCLFISEMKIKIDHGFFVLFFNVLHFIGKIKIWQLYWPIKVCSEAFLVYEM